MKSKGQSNRGGPRPGAGAPEGNTNNLKHGKYSDRFKRIRAAIEDHITEATEYAKEIRIETDDSDE